MVVLTRSSRCWRHLVALEVREGLGRGLLPRAVGPGHRRGDAQRDHLRPKNVRKSCRSQKTENLPTVTSVKVYLFPHHLDFAKFCEMNIHFQKSASILPRTSPDKCFLLLGLASPDLGSFLSLDAKKVRGLRTHSGGAIFASADVQNAVLPAVIIGLQMVPVHA